MRGVIAALVLGGCSTGNLKETAEPHETGSPPTTSPTAGTDTEDPEDTAPDLDPDGDGVETPDEIEAGTDPEDADSDDDGQSDGAELAGGTDPLNPYSRAYTGGYNIGDCLMADLPTTGGPSATTYQLGDTVLNFGLSDQHGEVVDLYSFCGRTTILTFGATWCEACNYDAAKKQALMDEYAEDGVQILEVLIDNYADSELAAAWADAYGLETVAVLADPALGDAVWYDFEGDPYIPSNFVIGPDLTVIGWEVFNPDPGDWID